MMRPTPATWFEILSAKDDATTLVEALATAGCAEFEPTSLAATADERAETLRQRFRELERRYHAAWPIVPALPAPHAYPATVLERAVERIERWAAVTGPELDALAGAQVESAALARWQRLLAAPEIGPAERAALAGADCRLTAALFSGDPVATVGLPPMLIARPLQVAGENYLLVIGTPAALAELGEQIGVAGGRRIEAPDLLAAADPLAALAAAREACLRRIAALEARLASIAAEFSIADAIAEAEQGCWCLANVASVRTRQALCGVTGWTGDPLALARTLDACGAHALVRFGPAPAGLRPPLLLHNPWWARPYEFFGSLVGMPERNAADPAVVVAVAFPLLFGYMFGDLGQGLLLVAVGLAFGKRWPLLRLLIPGGAMAAVFGLLFGSVFSLHGILPPLWVDPLADPLRVLLAPLFGGAALLVAGLVLGALAARWRGELGAWWRADGAAALVFIGLLAGLADLAAFAAAALVALAAAALEARHSGRGSAFFAALGETAEKSVQLAINTLSFVRVGAFAIAHAGLSAALGLLVSAAGDAAPVVIVLGNAFIIALEVLVVSIQTTRLLLFEFFIRFFTGTGRAFQPAPPPPSEPQEYRHEP
jgi:V/A-type H+/Na+-transporting ATPase subunit I